MARDRDKFSECWEILYLSLEIKGPHLLLPPPKFIHLVLLNFHPFTLSVVVDRNSLRYVRDLFIIKGCFVNSRAPNFLYLHIHTCPFRSSNILTISYQAHSPQIQLTCVISQHLRSASSALPSLQLQTSPISPERPSKTS